MKHTLFIISSLCFTPCFGSQMLGTPESIDESLGPSCTHRTSSELFSEGATTPKLALCTLVIHVAQGVCTSCAAASEEERTLDVTH